MLRRAIFRSAADSFLLRCQVPQAVEPGPSRRDQAPEPSQLATGVLLPMKSLEWLRADELLRIIQGRDQVEAFELAAAVDALIDCGREVEARILREVDNWLVLNGPEGPGVYGQTIYTISGNCPRSMDIDRLFLFHWAGEFSARVTEGEWQIVHKRRVWAFGRLPKRVNYLKVGKLYIGNASGPGGCTANVEHLPMLEADQDSYCVLPLKQKGRPK